MTNDLLPDEIYVRRTTKKGLSAVRPESPLADRTVPNQASKLNRTKYIRGDLVSTPNKPAEVDLDALKRGACKWYTAKFDNNEFIGMPSDREVMFGLLDYLHSSGHLATGKGGDLPSVCDGKEQDAFEEWAQFQRMDMQQHPLHWLFLNPVTSAARDGWKAGIEYCREMVTAQQKTAEPCGDEPHPCACKFKDDECIDPCAYHVDLEAGYKQLEKINDELGIKLAKWHNEKIGFTAAPTQIDAGELEAALEYRKSSYEAAIAQRDAFYGMNKDRPVNHDNVIYEAARAHLEKSKGGV